MTLPPALAETLRRTAAALAPTREPWWIIGSAAVALHGGDATGVRDVDVLLAFGDTAAVLAPLGIVPAPGPAHAIFRSEVFARWLAAPLPVEFMADFTHRDEPVAPRTRQAVSLGTACLYVPDRTELHAILMRFGRQKDLSRAAMLDIEVGPAVKQYRMPKA